MQKKILTIFYSQSGQLEEVIRQFTAPLIEAGHAVETLAIRPVKSFPFPWTSPVFFDAMPESVLLKPAELEPFRFGETRYDLIVIGYQPWFLSPSIPASSLMQHPAFKVIARDTPVITISACRNMWINAQEKTKQLLSDAGARLVGNIALVDRHHNYVSLVTILLWMFSGRKEKRWAFLPKPGVSDQDIAQAQLFGRIAADHLESSAWDGLQPQLQEHGAVEIKYPLMFIERRAGRIFEIWAKLIGSRKNRSPWLVAFKYYLLVALCVAAPVILLVDGILSRPFFRNRIRQQEQYYSGITLKL